MEGTQFPIMGVRPWLSLRQEVAIAQEPPKLNSPLADATTISRRRDLKRRREALCEWLSRPREQAVRPACMPQFAHFVCAICFTALGKLGSTEPPCHIGRHICLRFPIDFSHVSAGPIPVTITRWYRRHIYLPEASVTTNFFLLDLSSVLRLSHVVG
jgi:hypothetical protein